MKAGAAALVLAVAAAATAHAADADVATALAAIAKRSTIELTTTGRKTGKPHTKPIWFVVDGGKIVVQAGKDGKTDWYQNLLAKPEAEARQSEYAFRVRATPLVDAARVEAIHQLFLSKYTSAWLLSFVGSSIGRGKPVELTPLSVAVSR